MSGSGTSDTACFETITHIVAGVYQFSNEGKNEVICKFKMSMAPKEVFCEYTNNRFVIKSDPEHSEEALSTFIRLIPEYIKTEMEKEEYIGAPMVSRTEGMYVEALSSESSDGYYANDADNVSDRDEDNGQTDDARLGAHFTETWKVGSHMQKPIPLSILNGLKELNVGSCEFALVDEMIEISAGSMDSVASVISVLEGVRSMISQQTQSSVMFDFHIAEGEIAYLLELKILPKAPDQRLKRTLVQPTAPYATLLHERLVVLMFKVIGNPVTKAKPAAQTSRPFTTNSELWHDQLIFQRGDKSLLDTFMTPESVSTEPTNDVTPTLDLIPPKAPNPVSLWVEQSAAIAAEMGSDPFAAPEEESEIQQTPSHEQQQEMPRRHAKVRKPKGTNLENQLEPSLARSRTPSNPVTTESGLPTPNVSTGSPHGTSNEDRLSKKSDVLDRSSAASRSQRSKAASLCSIASHVLPHHLRPPEILPPVMPKPNQLLDDGDDDFSGPHAWQHPPVHSARLGNLVAPGKTMQQAHSPLLDVSVPGKNLAVLQAHVSNDLNLHIDRHGLSQLDMNPQTSTNAVNNENLTHHHEALDGDDYDLLLEFDAVRVHHNPAKFVSHAPSIEENLIDLDFDEAQPVLTTVEENFQLNGEVESRRLRHTMNQQKGTSSSGPLGGRAETLRRFDDSITKILEPVRTFPGIINLTVNIGRLLIDTNSVAAEYKRRSFTKEDWERIFSGNCEENKHNTELTQILTTSAADAEFLLNLSLPSGRKLFQKDVSERKVKFLFVCRSKADDEFLIEVDEGGKFQLLTNPHLIGALNWHFPKRIWDARLAVTTSFCNYFDDDQLASAKAIVDSLCILPSKDHVMLDLYTRSGDPALKIRSIFLRRETCHLSKLYSDLVLHLTEAQELYVNMPTGSKCDYHAYTRSAQDMVKDGNKLWWEASLSSITADKALGLNQILKFGDTANWTVDDIVGKGYVKDLSDLAMEVVTRIDSVGLHNSKVKTREEVKAQGGTSASVVASNAEFW